MLSDYEQDYSQSIIKIKDYFSRFQSTDDDIKKKTILDTLKKEITNCERKLKSIELECSLLKDKQPNPLMFQQKIRRYRDDYEIEKKKIMILEINFLEKTQKKELFNARKIGPDTEGNYDSRKKLLLINEKAYQQNQTVKEITVIANEIDERGNLVNRELYFQRLNIEKGVNDNKEIDRSLNRAKYTMDQISRRECVNKSVLWLTIITLSLANLILLIKIMLH